LAVFVAAVEMSVVATAMPTVVADLGGALHYGWVFSAYMLTQTATMPIYGKIADLYGRKPVLFVAMAIFLLASMASGQARSMTALIVFRAIQGIGAGGIQPIAVTVVGDIFDLDERAKMQGLLGAVWAIAGLLGPFLGGLLVATMSWRWVFYINVPIGILSVAILSVSLVETIERKTRKLDIAGAVTLSCAVVALLLGVEGFVPGVLLPLSALSAIAFIAAEFRAPQPMLPPRLFGQRVLAISSGVAVLLGAVQFSIIMFLPLYAQGILDASPTQAGATIAPMGLGWPIASVIAGHLLRRVGARTIVRAGMVVFASTALALALVIARGATTLELRALSGLLGAGMGLASTAILILIQSSVPFEERGVVTASNLFFRSIGGTLGVGVMGAVLARRLLANPLVRAGGGVDLVSRLLGPGRRTIPAGVLSAVSGDLQQGITRVLWVCASLGLLALIIGWLFPKLDLGAAASGIEKQPGVLIGEKPQRR
jgi:EmrB/QacA subfamily drug resistance transporter